MKKNKQYAAVMVGILMWMGMGVLCAEEGVDWVVPVDGAMPGEWEWPHGGELGWEFDEEGVLAIKIGAGTLLGLGNTAKVYALRALTERRFSVAIRLGLDETVTGEWAGLMLYYDADNFVKLVRIDGGEDGVRLQMFREERGEWVSVASVRSDSEVLDLQLTLRGPVLEAAYRTPEGRAFQRLGSTTMPAVGGMPKLGMITGGGDGSGGRVNVHWLRYLSAERPAGE